MKIYITGSVGSGKTTLAREISRASAWEISRASAWEISRASAWEISRASAWEIGEMGIPCFELDAVAYEPDPDHPGNNRKRPAEVRDALFADILSQQNWVMEDAGRPCFLRGMEQADQIILLEPAAFVRDFRILRRWLRQRAGREYCRYRPDFTMLRCMFRWRRNYDSGKDDLKKRLEPFAGKLTVLRSEKEVRALLRRLREEGRFLTTF